MIRTILRRSNGLVRRYLSDDTAAGEQKIVDILKKNFPGATRIEVADASGGCGTFYQINIVWSQFKGKSLLDQHKMVNQALGDEIKKLHGINITTSSKQ